MEKNAHSKNPQASSPKDKTKFKIEKASKRAAEKNHFWLAIFMLSNNDWQACWRLQNPMVGCICTEKNIFGMILYSSNFFNVL